MVENFNLFVDLVLRAEGGLSNDTSDRGGLTNRGITAKTFQDYINDAEDRDFPCSLEEASERLYQISEQDAIQIYQCYYWDAVKADELPSGVDIILADWAVNSGPTSAITNLQELVLARPDGLLGPKTLLKVMNKPPKDLAFELYLRRLKSYRTIASMYDNKKFWRGWNNRITTLFNELIKEGLV